MANYNTNEQKSDVIDSEQFEELRELLEDDFIGLVKTYITDSKTRLTEMQEAITSHNNAKGFDAAHTLKGASANLGAKKLTELCYQMQEAFRNHQNETQNDLIGKIEQELKLVHQDVEQRIA